MEWEVKVVVVKCGRCERYLSDGKVGVIFWMSGRSVRVKGSDI